MLEFLYSGDYSVYQRDDSSSHDAERIEEASSEGKSKPYIALYGPVSK